MLPKVFASKYLVLGGVRTPAVDNKSDEKSGAPGGPATGITITPATGAAAGTGSGDSKSSAGDNKDGGDGRSGAAKAAPNSVTAEINDLYAQWKRIEEKTFTQFFQKCKREGDGEIAFIFGGEIRNLTGRGGGGGGGGGGDVL